MITDQDIQKLAKVFATKEDLTVMKDQIIDEIISNTKQEILKIYELLDQNTDENDKLYKEQQGHRIAIGDHEARIRNLEHASA